MQRMMILFIFFLIACAGSPSVEWIVGSFQNVLKTAADVEKPILVYFTSPT